MSEYAFLAAGMRVFTVEGAGEFPVDMLRYDRCFPISYEDWLKMHVRYTDYPYGGGVEGKFPDATERRRVRLASQSRSFSCPTVARWESFNWQVVA
jgi:hypothetical protein